MPVHLHVSVAQLDASKQITLPWGIFAEIVWESQFKSQNSNIAPFLFSLASIRMLQFHYQYSYDFWELQEEESCHL